jgi:hypothetical protein
MSLLLRPVPGEGKRKSEGLSLFASVLQYLVSVEGKDKRAKRESLPNTVPTSLFFVGYVSHPPRRQPTKTINEYI